MDCCLFSYFSLFPPTRKKRHQKVAKLVRKRRPSSSGPDLFASTLDLGISTGTPCFGQVRPSCRSWSPSWRQLGATSLKIYQKPNPETKTTQESPNLRQPCSKQLKNHPPDPRKSSKSDGLLFVFILFAIPIHSQKKTPRGFKIG